MEHFTFTLECHKHSGDNLQVHDEMWWKLLLQVDASLRWNAVQVLRARCYNLVQVYTEMSCKCTMKFAERQTCNSMKVECAICLQFPSEISWNLKLQVLEIWECNLSAISYCNLGTSWKWNWSEIWNWNLTAILNCNFGTSWKCNFSAISNCNLVTSWKWNWSAIWKCNLSEIS